LKRTADTTKSVKTDSKTTLQCVLTHFPYQPMVSTIGEAE